MTLMCHYEGFKISKYSNLTVTTDTFNIFLAVLEGILGGDPTNHLGTIGSVGILFWSDAVEVDCDSQIEDVWKPQGYEWRKASAVDKHLRKSQEEDVGEA